ncbi:hypothetical protein C8R45DRAFT_1106082 [Mycena sanguinolenta]|nr:hypothetical protein C8R45DRAFT_1106082 [Mycena sanguinolenta]
MPRTAVQQQVLGSVFAATQTRSQPAYALSRRIPSHILRKLNSGSPLSPPALSETKRSRVRRTPDAEYFKMIIVQKMWNKTCIDNGATSGPEQRGEGHKPETHQNFDGYSHAQTSTNAPATLAALLGLDAAPVEEVADDAALLVLPVVLTFAGAVDAAEPDEPLSDVEDGSESGGLKNAGTTVMLVLSGSCTRKDVFDWSAVEAGERERILRGLSPYPVRNVYASLVFKLPSTISHHLVCVAPYPPLCLQTLQHSGPPLYIQWLAVFSSSRTQASTRLYKTTTSPLAVLPRAPLFSIAHLGLRAAGTSARTHRSFHPRFLVSELSSDLNLPHGTISALRPGPDSTRFIAFN